MIGFPRYASGLQKKLIHPLQHRRRHQFAFNMALNALGQEAAKIGAAAAYPARSIQAVQRQSKNFCCHFPGISTYFSAGQSLVVGAEQTVGQRMEISAASIQDSSAHYT